MDRLASILARMVKSALEWERERQATLSRCENGRQNALTGIPHRIHSPPQERRPRRPSPDQGDIYDNDHKDPE